MKDFQGNEVVKGDSVIFVKKPTGELKVGTISFIGKYGTRIISTSLTETRYWREGKEILKIVPIKGSKTKAPVIKQSVPEMKPNYLNKHPSVSKKRIQHIISAFPTVKWDPDSIKITIIGYGDRPAFTMCGHIRVPLNGVIENVMWHSNTPGGGASRIYYTYKNRKRVMKSTLRNGEKTINKIINMIGNKNNA